MLARLPLFHGAVLQQSASNGREGDGDRENRERKMSVMMIT
jgi:hypothetical protein